MKNIELSLIRYFVDDKNMCLVDSATMHTILTDLKYFSYLKKQTANVSTICGSAKLIEDSRKAHIISPRGTNFVIDDKLYFEKSQRNLLSFCSSPCSFKNRNKNYEGNKPAVQTNT